MIRVCFVCLGNICRSPMAEFIMKDKVKKMGLDKEFYIASRATSYEEEGNDMYPPAREMLNKMNVSFTRHSAKRLEKSDLDMFDYFFCMDDNNVNSVSNILGDSSKVFKLLDRNIADPWYTLDFLTTYNELNEGIDLLLTKFKK